jgi:hypothetical protein
MASSVFPAIYKFCGPTSRYLLDERHQPEPRQFYLKEKVEEGKLCLEPLGRIAEDEKDVRPGPYVQFSPQSQLAKLLEN